MMNLLLDTQIVLWFLNGENRLSEKAYFGIGNIAKTSQRPL